MRRRTSLLLAVLAMLVASGAGCDDGTPTSGASTASSASHTDAVRAGVAALYAGDHPTPAEVTESECFAGALLERIDPDGLVAAGIVAADGSVAPVLPALDEPTAARWVAAQGECTDFVEVSTRALGAQSKGKIDPEVYAGCLTDALTPAEVDAALVDTLTGAFDTPQVAALSRAQADCARSASPPE